MAAPASAVKPDSTETDVCVIEVLGQDMETGKVTVQVTAMDYDSGMLYYAYSYDNGETFSPLQEWGDRKQDTITFTMQVPPHIVPQIVVNGYNGYDLYKTSNMISLPSMDYQTEEEQAAELAAQEALESAAMTETPDAYTEITYDTVSEETEQAEPVSLRYFLTVCAVCALLVLGLVFSLLLLLRSRKSRRRRRKRYSAYDRRL